MVKKIKKYLAKKTRDYDEGLILLSKASKNRILIQRLGRKELKDKLEYELQKIVNRENSAFMVEKLGNIESDKTVEDSKKKEIKSIDEDIPVIEEPKRLRVVRGDNKINYKDLPKDLQALWDENAEKYKLSRSLHEKLKLMEKAKPEDRKPLIEQLHAYSDKVRTNWDVIDAYDPNAKPEKKEEKPSTKVDHKRINTNRKYISTNLKKLQVNPDDKALKQKIQDRITEIVKAGESFKDAKKLTDLGFEV